MRGFAAARCLVCGVSLCGDLEGGGGARRDRTADLLHAMQALSQLSYGPNHGTEVDRRRSEIQVALGWPPTNDRLPIILLPRFRHRRR
jgi:hypothetical protein